MRKLAVIVGLLASAHVALHAQTTRPATLPATTQPTTRPATGPATRPLVDLPDPDKILQQLASTDWHERRDAQDRLVRLGEDGKPFIHELIDRATSDEARKNAQAALFQIDQNRQLGPSYLTLHFKNAPAKEVFAEISRQCFAPLLTMPDNLWEQGGFQNLTIDVDHKPFWEVVPPLCQQLGVDFRPWQYGMRIMRTGAMQLQGVPHVEGAFLVVANQVNYSRTRFFGQNANEQAQFGITFSVYPEPKITVLRGSGTVHLTEVTDDHGNSLVANDVGPRVFFNGFANFGGMSLNAPLRYPRNLGTKIVRLSGSTTFVIQTKMERLEIPDVLNLKPSTRTIGGMQVMFKEMKKNGDSFQLHLHVGQTNFGGPEYQQLMEGAQTRLQLLDAAGNQLDHRGMGTSGNNQGIDMTIDFGRGVRFDGRTVGDPVKLVWDVPTESRDITVPVEFRDLPLFAQ